jgi:thioredoxin-related protein
MNSTVALSRRHLLLAAASASIANKALAAPAVPIQTLPLARSLPDELSRALKHEQALVVMVSLANCPFCHVVRQNYLGPLQAQQGLSVVQVDMHSKQLVQNFDGTSLSHEELRRTWGVRIAPTVVFFGSGAKELAPRLAGASIPDFYGAYLEQRLQQARATIRQKT